MAHISIQNLVVDFRVYGSNARSLKKRILSQATGGRIAGSGSEGVTVRAIDHLSLEIREGDRIGLVGHNGAGKTTLLRTIAGIFKPTAGALEIEGTVGALLDPSAGMDVEATGRENIFLRGYVLGMSKAEIAARIDEIAEFTELGDFLELPVKTYSAGMYSRLGFALSTSIAPDILLIDEGIGAGDERFQKKAKLRTDEAIHRSKILIVASHSNELIDTYCNRKLTFERGRIIDETHIDHGAAASAASA